MAQLRRGLRRRRRKPLTTESSWVSSATTSSDWGTVSDTSDVIDVRNKIAMVSGCSSGMGRADAKALAAHGAVVALCARRVDRLEELAAEITNDGGRALVVPMDASVVADVRDAVQAIGEKLGPIDILVNNAAVTKQSPVIDVEEEYFDWIYGTNIKGAFFVAQAVARQMIENKREGRIINISSMTALRPVRRQAVYSSAKAALIHASKVMALEWAPHKINVNVICPGYIDTEMSAGFEKTPVGQKFLETLPRRRIGDPYDLTGLVLLLASGQASRLITGTVIQVDDGAVLADGLDGLTN
jgi:NAD(P)-dependent dehydrogenase (short-subunit alcohol dehydrogenase family)